MTERFVYEREGYVLQASEPPQERIEGRQSVPGDAGAWVLVDEQMLDRVRTETHGCLSSVGVDMQRSS